MYICAAHFQVSVLAGPLPGSYNHLIDGAIIRRLHGGSARKGTPMSSVMVSMLAFVAGIKERIASEKGATATEYSLLVAFIALLIIVGVTAFGGALNTWFTNLGTTVGGW